MDLCGETRLLLWTLSKYVSGDVSLVSSMSRQTAGRPGKGLWRVSNGFVHSMESGFPFDIFVLLEPGAPDVVQQTWKEDLSDSLVSTNPS